jgi:hypothetical protein
VLVERGKRKNPPKIAKKRKGKARKRNQRFKQKKKQDGAGVVNLFLAGNSRRER